MKKRGFIEGALIIAVANILVKIIGAVFKIPLDRAVLKTDGMALYNTAYTIYNLLFVVSTAGLPTAISKLVAESDSRNEQAESTKILRVSLVLLACLGGIGTLILGVGAHFFSSLVGYSDAALTMMAMSPSLLFVACMSAFRGYFQGQHNMFPTAISEVIEALCKLAVGLSLAWLLLPMGKPAASAGAILGVTVGSICGAVFLFLCYMKQRKPAEKRAKTPTKTVLKNIVRIAVPITIGVSVFTLTSFIDTAMVTNQMKGYIYESEEANEAIYANLTEEKAADFSALNDEEGGKEHITERKAAFVYGYLVRAITLFNMPTIVIAAIATSVVPAIAAANAEEDKKKSRLVTKSALLIATVLALPAATGMSILAKPIFQTIYADGSFSKLLGVMGISVAFLTLVQIANAILQSWGKVWIPVINMLCGGAVKIGVNLLLVSRPGINICGAPVGTLLCYVVVTALDIAAIIRYTKTELTFRAFIVKPVLASALMGVCTWGVYRAAQPFFGVLISMALSVAVSVIVYLAAILLTKTLSEDEIFLLPKGEKIAGFMKKCGVLQKKS